MSDLDALAHIGSALPLRPPEAPSLSAAVGDFEGWFAGALLRIASEAGPKSTLLDGGSAGRMYREMFFDEIGRVVARSAGLGLAGSLPQAAADGSDGAEPDAGVAP